MALTRGRLLKNPEIRHRFNKFARILTKPFRFFQRTPVFHFAWRCPPIFSNKERLPFFFFHKMFYTVISFFCQGSDALNVYTHFSVSANDNQILNIFSFLFLRRTLNSVKSDGWMCILFIYLFIFYLNHLKILPN